LLPVFDILNELGVILSRRIKVMKTRLLQLGLLFCAAAIVQAQIRTVPSPEYITIQSAINNCIDNDTVVVNPGTYFENVNFLGKAITVRSINPDDPNIVTATIINGSIPADLNNASVVTFNHGEGNNSILEGFTLTGGTGTWVAIAWRFYTVYWNRCGGAIVCYNMSQPTITKNHITHNTTGEGGGVYVYGNPVNPASPSNPPGHLKPIISYNTFESNSAIVNHGFLPPNIDYEVHNHGDGGAIVCFQGVDPQITGNTIQSNHADNYGGGIHLRQWSNGTIQENRVQQNDSLLGAGVHITYNSSPHISKNTICKNKASSLGGGGVYVYYQSAPVFEYNYLSENESASGAGIGVYWESTPLIKNNIFFKNLKGAGVYITGSANPRVIYNTIIQNAGGIQIYGTVSPVIENNLIASNGSNAYGIYAYEATPVIRYCDVWNHPKGNYNSAIGDQTGINGNISADPNFSDPNDFHIMPFSPCVNAGDPAAAFPSDTLDIDGESRIFNTRVDIGADEMHLIAADFNTNGIVDVDDLLILCDEWLSNTLPLQADLTGNGIVDLSDVAAFAKSWLDEANWKSSLN
jgi:parallel beta-helix repeat protein